jgi:spore coat protein U-like protein
MCIMKKFLIYFLTATGLCFTGHAHAASADGCNFNIPPLNFGVYSFIQKAPNDSSNNIKIECQNSTVVTVQIGAGQSGTVLNRYMIDAKGNQLKYNLYIDASRLGLLGDGNNGSSYFNGQNVGGIGAHPNMIIYGRLFPNQSIPAGNYSDSLVLNISF